MLMHPWALGIGAAAISLPVLIHWLTRPRPVTLPLSTIRFVREAVQQRRARYRLRDIIILLLRTAAVVRIVILDRSQSMAAVSGGVQAFERGRAAAAKQLAYTPGLRADLILAAARP